jgi:lysophospholipase L1-like esterase
MSLFTLLILWGCFVQDIWTERAGKMVIIFVSLVEVFRLVKRLVYDQSGKKLRNSILLCFGVFAILFYSLEVVFLFIPRSHGVGYTKAAQLWFHKFWQKNSLGFRDVEPVAGKPAVLFIGDSFTAGHGIKNPDDRFSSIFKSNHPDLQVLNLGENGANTGTEYQTMLRVVREASLQPKAIVLQYYGNDIEGAAAEKGLVFEGQDPLKNKHIVKQRLINGSHLLNYFYWLIPHNTQNNYLSQLSKAYNDKDVMSLHYGQLDSFKLYAKSRRIPFVVVVFPFLQNIPFSDSLYVNKIAAYCSINNISCVNVSDLVRKEKTNNLVVNSNDGHPSVFVNLQVAKALNNKLQIQ